MDTPRPTPGLPPLAPRAAATHPPSGLPPLRTAPAGHDQVVRVHEVKPRWQKLLLIACAVVGAIGGAGSLALQVVGGGEVARQVTPIADLAQRTDNGLRRVDATAARIREFLAPLASEPPGRAAPAPASPGAQPAPAEYRLGPFVVRRGPHFIEVGPANP